MVGRHKRRPPTRPLWGMEHPDEHAGAYAAEMARIAAQADSATAEAYEALD